MQPTERGSSIQLTRQQLEGLRSPSTPAHAEMSGVRLVTDGLDAFAQRAHSARAAASSIDVQYYIWHSDSTGRVLVHELLQAADRGVRIRVLLDDVDARSRDSALVALDRHRHIEVRLFNPFAARSGMLRTLLELFASGSRLNRRMHNKAWIVDRRLAIVGGRNIGDEYFAASEGVNFVDTDVLLSGSAVEQTLHHFEEYWNNPAAIAIARLRRMGGTRWRLDHVRRRLGMAARTAANSMFAQRLQASLRDESVTRQDALEWVRRVDVVADDPSKANRDHGPLAPGVLESITAAFETAQSELLLISPYFVPGAVGTAQLRELVRRGANVSVLTNSLAATDVAAVHSGYSRYRQLLLEGGVKLYEMKDAISPFEHGKRMRVGSSRASLHTKAAIVDRRRLFVGSFNLDPRSAELNCEMGAWIDSEPLAHQLVTHFEAAIRPENSYVVSLDSARRIRWLEMRDGVEVEHRRDPGAGWHRRALTWLLGLLPIESQL
jgi:cardiolipin synthase C